MIIVLTAVIALWLTAALVLAFAGGAGSHVDRALASTEQVRLTQSAWDEFEQTRTAWAKDATDIKVAA